MKASKVKPISFSPAMVAAIRENRKSQTRRLYRGKPRWHKGDVCYVRERLLRARRGGVDDAVVYDDGELALDGPNFAAWRWQRPVLPARYMPKSLARMFIRIVRVGAEPLHQITARAIEAEGVCVWETYIGGAKCSRPELFLRFSDLWDSLHDKPGERWADNPMVEVLYFNRITKEDALR